MLLGENSFMNKSTICSERVFGRCILIPMLANKLHNEKRMHVIHENLSDKKN